MAQMGSINERADELGIPRTTMADSISVIANFALVAARGDAGLAATLCVSASTAVIDSYTRDYDPGEVADQIRAVALSYLETHKAYRLTLN